MFYNSNWSFARLWQEAGAGGVKVFSVMGHGKSELTHHKLEAKSKVGWGCLCRFPDSSWPNRASGLAA
jgi:hypothetical protein